MAELTDFEPLHPNAGPQSINDRKRNPISAGLSSGVDDLQGLGYSAGAAIADAVGAKGARDWLNQRAEQNQVESYLNSRPDLERIEDQSLSSAIPYAVYQVSKQVPNVAGAIGASLVVPEVAVPAWLARGGALMPRALGGGGAAGRIAAASAEGGSTIAARRAAIETGRDFGKTIVGGLAFNEGQAIGSLYQEALDAGDPNAGIKAIAGSPAYALTETLPEAMLVGRFKGGSGFSGNFMTRGLKSAGVQGTAGATSELLQNEMEMAYGPERTDEQKFSQRLNSGVAGGLVEGIFGLGGGMGRGKSFVRDANPAEADAIRAEETPLLGYTQNPNRNPTIISFPDGSAASPQELEQYLNGYKPEERPMVLGRMLGMVKDREPIPDVVREGAGMSTVDLINFMTGVSRRNTENTQQSMEVAYNEPTSQYAQNDLGHEYNVSYGDLTGAGVAGGLPNPTAVKVQTQAAQEQAAADAQAKRDAIIEKYGRPEPFTNPVTGQEDGFTWHGKNYHSAQELNKAIDALIKADAGKPVGLQQAEAVAMQALGQSVSPKFMQQLFPMKLALGAPDIRTLAGRLIEHTKSLQDKLVREEAKNAEGANMGNPDTIADLNAKLVALKAVFDAAEITMPAASVATPTGTGEAQSNQPRPTVPTTSSEPSRGEIGIGASTSEVTTSEPKIVVKRGRKQVEVTKAEMAQSLREAPAEDKAMILDALGKDGQGNQVGQPASLTEIATRHEARTGKKLTKQAIQQRLAKYGITASAVDKASATALDTVDQSEIIPTTNEEAGAGTGFAIVDNPNKSTVIEPAMTSKQRELKKQADAELEEKGAEPTVQTAKEIESEAAIEAKRKAEAEASLASAIAQMTSSPMYGEVRTAWDQMRSQATPRFKELMAGEQLEWFSAYNEYKVGNISEDELNDEQRDIERNLEVVNGTDTLAPAERVLQVPVGDRARESGAQDGDREARPDNAELRGEVRSEGAQAANEGRSESGAGKPAVRVKKKRALVKDEGTAPKEQEPVLTQREKAAKAWDVVARSVPGMPTFADLSEADQKTFTEFGEENWTRRDVAKFAAEREQAAPKAQAEDKKLASNSMPFYELEQEEAGAADTTAAYEELGIAHALDAVESWGWESKSVLDGTGQVRLVDGKYVGTLATELRTEATRGYMEMTISHEIGHAVDMALHGDGVYSSQPEMRIALTPQGKVVPVGSVAREVFALWRNGKENGLRKFFDYPLNRKQNADLDARTTQQELFSQLWSLYTFKEGREMLEREAPEAAKFFAEVINHVRSTEAFSSPTEEAAQERAQDFGSRNPGTTVGDSQGRSGSDGQAQGGQEQKTLSSRSAPFRRQQAQERINQLPEGLRPAAFTIWDTLSDSARKGMYATAFTSDLLDIAEKYMPQPVAKYLSAMREKEQLRRKYEMEVEKVLEKFDDLPEAQRDAVNKFLYDSTIQGKWGFKPAYRTNVQVDPEFQKRFESLPKSARAVVEAVFKHGHDTLMQKNELLTKEINADADDQIAKANGNEEEIARIKKARDRQLKLVKLPQMQGPYAPLKRYGNYVVVARSAEYQKAVDEGDQKTIEALEANEDHNYVTFVDTAAEAQALARKFRDAGKVSEGFSKEVGRDILYGNGQNQFEAFRKLREMMSEEFRDNPKLARSIDRTLSDLYLTTLAESSARRSEISRKNIAGADKDMMRAFATQGRADAMFISALARNADATTALVNMRQETSKMDGNRAIRSDLYNELMKRHADGMTYNPSPMMDKMMGFTSLWMLATSPMYYVQNMLQTGMVTAPVLAGRFGGFKTYRSLATAYKEIAGALEGRFTTSIPKLPKDVQAVIQTLIDRGLIDVTGTADMGETIRNGSGNTSVMDKVLIKLRNAPRKVEIVNRISAAMAAYRLAKKDGKMSDEAATEYAAKVVLQTHGDYSGTNAPRIMRNSFVPGAKLVTQFRKYQIIQLSLLARLLKDSFAGASSTERAVARKALTFLLGHTGVMAGAMGLPAAGAVGWVLAKAFGDDDEPEDAELMLRRAIGDDFMADLLLKGVPAALGVDLSNRLGLQNATSILPFSDGDITSKSGVEKLIVSATGPFIGGLLPRFADGVSLMSQGDYYKGMERLAPKGIADAMKAGRFLNEGVTQRNGDLVMASDEVGLVDALMQAGGAPTTTITDRQFRGDKLHEFEDFYKNRQTELKRDYTRAFKDGDAGAMADIRQEWMNMQEAQRRNGFKPATFADLLKAPQKQMKREREVIGGIESRSSNAGFLRNMVSLEEN